MPALHMVTKNPFGGRVEADAYCAIENYRGVTLRYTDDPRRPGKVRVYVETSINWGGRNSSAHISHLWPANHDGSSHPPYLCIKEQFAPSTYEEAKKQAEAWVRGTANYLVTGEDITSALSCGKTL